MCYFLTVSMHFNCIAVLFILCSVTYCCHVCINELNIDNSEEPEKHEFLELAKCGCPGAVQPSYDNQMILIIKEYEN